MDMFFSEFEKYCYDLFYGNIEISRFEAWVYSSTDLESILNQDDYLELISLDFKSHHIKYEIEKILEKYIDLGRFERQRIVSLLYDALKSKKDWPDILRRFYGMYCNGYYFFEDLGLGYGLTCEVPPSKYGVETLDELDEVQKNEIIDSFFPQIEYDINCAIDWIENSKIILTGTRNEIGHWEFIEIEMMRKENPPYGLRFLTEQKNDGAAC